MRMGRLGIQYENWMTGLVSLNNNDTTPSNAKTQASTPEYASAFGFHG